VKPLYIVFSRKAPGFEQKLKDFNEGLARLERTGTLRAILRKYGFQPVAP
jgi:ABC-type amino acid transport substrate-binding protein